MLIDSFLLEESVSFLKIINFVLYNEISILIGRSKGGKSALSLNISRNSNTFFWKTTALDSYIKYWNDAVKLLYD